MARLTLAALLAASSLASALASTSRQMPVEVFSEEESNRIIGQARQADTVSNTGSGGFPWFRENSVSEAFSVLFNPSNRRICRTAQNEVYNMGVCTRVTDCMYYSGESYGSCGIGLGSCCVFEKKCGESTDLFISHFVNPSFSTVDRGTGECRLTVKPMNPNICQYRLDFENFEILGPSNASKCVNDFFGVTGGSAVPKLCGELTGQHVYVNVKPGGGPILLTTDTSKVHTMARTWNIRITQIACDSPERAPAGCLQFFNETSGTVKSFNFKNSLGNESKENTQIQELNYGICINSKVGYCDLTWTQSKGNRFSVSGDATAEDVDGTPLKTSLKGTKECTTDYVTIPGGRYVLPDTKEEKHADRYCGTDIPEVKTASQPYTIQVVTDSNEEEDTGNQGFEINFRQNLCHT